MESKSPLFDVRSENGKRIFDSGQGCASNVKGRVNLGVLLKPQHVMLCGSDEMKLSTSKPQLRLCTWPRYSSFPWRARQWLV